MLVNWDDVEGADDYLVRWRLQGPEQDLNDGVRSSSTSTQVTVSGADTCADDERYFSYRRACLRGEAGYGRALSAIALVE